MGSPKTRDKASLSATGLCSFAFSRFFHVASPSSRVEYASE